MTRPYLVGWDCIKALAAGKEVLVRWGVSIAAADDLIRNDIEAGRLLAMSDDQVRAECVARGEDLDAVAEDARVGLSSVVELHKEVVALRARVVELEGRYGGLSAEEHVRRVRCSVSEIAHPNTARGVCDLILKRLSGDLT